MQKAVRHIRTIAAFLAITVAWNGFAHAAKPSRRLALLQAATQTSQTTAAVEPNATPSAVQAASSTQPAGARERTRLAHTVLLSQTGNDPDFALPETDTYNTVLNALNQWGRFRIVTDASQADLVLQLHGVAIASATGDSNGSVVYASTLHLTVADPHTLSPVWEVSVPVQPALREKSRTRNIALTGENAVSQLKLLAGDPLSLQEKAQLKAASNSHASRIVWFSAAGVALTLGLFFIARHAAQQNQANFCQQHGISPCPGA